MKQVAAIIGISKNTFAFHKYKMMKRLGIESNAGLIPYAMRRYMAPPKGSWTVTGPDGTTFTVVPQEKRNLPASPRCIGKGQLQLKAAARTWQRVEDRNEPDIQ